MIVGMGTDIVQISRIAALILKFETRFLHKCFTAAEIARAQTKNPSAAAFARLYAAKEAALKALGTGMRSGLSWHDIEIIHSALGQPNITINSGYQHLLNEKTVHEAICHLSMSDDGDYAVATVIIETT